MIVQLIKIYNEGREILTLTGEQAMQNIVFRDFAKQLTKHDAIATIFNNALVISVPNDDINLMVMCINTFSKMRIDYTSHKFMVLPDEPENIGKGIFKYKIKIV